MDETIKNLKCIGCGEVGTLREYEYVEGRGNDATFKLANEDETEATGFRRFVCCNCFITQSYWFTAKELLKTEAEINRRRNSNNSYLERNVQVLRDALIKMTNEIYDIVISNCNPEPNYEKCKLELNNLKNEFNDENISVKRYNELKDIIEQKEKELDKLSDSVRYINDIKENKERQLKKFSELKLDTKPFYIDPNDGFIKGPYDINGYIALPFNPQPSYDVSYGYKKDTIVHLMAEKYPDLVQKTTDVYNVLKVLNTRNQRYIDNEMERLKRYNDEQMFKIVLEYLAIRRYEEEKQYYFKNYNEAISMYKDRFNVDLTTEINSFVEKLKNEDLPEFDRYVEKVLM